MAWFAARTKERGAATDGSQVEDQRDEMLLLMAGRRIFF
jgi:hypothetical protein